MKKLQKGFTGIEIAAALAVILAVGMLAPKVVEGYFKNSCEGAGFERSSNPAEGCSGFPWLNRKRD